MSIEKLGQYFVAVEDPRCSGKVEHRLIEMLVIAVCAVIACAESWDGIALYGRSKLQYRSLCDPDGGIEVDARGRLRGARAQRVAAHLALDPARHLPAPGTRHALFQDFGQHLMQGRPVPRGEKPQAAAACDAPRYSPGKGRLGVSLLPP